VKCSTARARDFSKRYDRVLEEATNSRSTGRNTEAEILARLIQTRQDELSRDAANYLLSLRFDDTDLSRMNELSELALLSSGPVPTMAGVRASNAGE